MFPIINKIDKFLTRLEIKNGKDTNHQQLK